MVVQLKAFKYECAGSAGGATNKEKTMRKLAKTLVPALAVVAALGAAVPAQAAYPEDYGRGGYNGYYRGHDDNNWGQSQAIRQRIDQLQHMVQRNDRRDTISEREAAGLRRDVWRLRDSFRAMNRDGLSQREARFLNDRINDIRERLHYERHDRDGRRL